MAETTRTSSDSHSGNTSSMARSDESASNSGNNANSGNTGAANLVSGAVTQAKDIGNELLGAVRDSATGIFDQQRSLVADQIAGVGGMLRSAVEGADQKDHVLVRYADDAARQIDGFVDTLRNRSWSELAGDIEDFARRWPMAFMASAIGLGFIAGRFIAASSERAGTQPGSDWTGSGSASRQSQPAIVEPSGSAHSADRGAVTGAASSTPTAGYGAAGPGANG